jgi:hypothetical protein
MAAKADSSHFEAIASMSEIVGAFARAELWDERANCASEVRHGSRRDLAQECLEFAVRQLDRIKVRRVFRKIPQARLRLLNRFPYGRSQSPDSNRAKTALVPGIRAE